MKPQQSKSKSLIWDKSYKKLKLYSEKKYNSKSKAKNVKNGRVLLCYGNRSLGFIKRAVEIRNQFFDDLKPTPFQIWSGLMRHSVALFIIR